MGEQRGPHPDLPPSRIPLFGHVMRLGPPLAGVFGAVLMFHQPGPAAVLVGLAATGGLLAVYDWL
jgi:hypothetical protein